MALLKHEEVTDLLALLEEDYSDRHMQCRRLRQIWHGNYWSEPESKPGSITSVFKDLVGGRSNYGPDIKVVHNVVQEICVKFQSFLSGLPMIRVSPDPGTNESSAALRRRQATLKERALYGLWSAGSMNRVLYKQGWYLPLMGDAFVGIWPDFDRSIVRPIIRSPEYAFPVPAFNVDGGLEAVIFSWSMKEPMVKLAFPNWNPKNSGGSTRSRITQVAKRPKTTPDEIEILEYSDTKQFVRYVDGQYVHGVEHDLGFNLFDQAQFIHVPDEPFGHGAVEQIVNLNELDNAAYGLLFQAFVENIFPTLVIRDPAKAPQSIMRGPGAVIPVNAGGDAFNLTPAVGALPVQVGFIENMEQKMRDGGSMPDVNFGRMRGSIVTGKAINELQGAATGSMVETVQLQGIGPVLSNWNSKALLILKRMFPNDMIRLRGFQPQTIADIRPREFGLSLRGREIVGSTDNDVVFAPSMDMHEKVVMGLQMAGAGLVSRTWQREQVGIPDSAAMEEEIMGEQVQDIALASVRLMLETMAQQGAIDTEQAQEIEGQMTSLLRGEAATAAMQPLPAMTQPVDAQQAMAQLAGGPAGAPGGGPAALPPGAPQGALPPGGGPPGIPPGGPPGAPAGMPPGAPPGMGMPPGMTPPGMPTGQAGAEQLPTGGEQPVTIEAAIGLFQSLEGITGRLFLIGEIVATGAATDTLEVAVTEQTDREIIMSQVPELQGFISFSVVRGTPSEPYIEVTPGAPPTPGGAEEDIAGLFA